MLCYLEDQTCESAARQLGWPVGTVKSRLARGRKRLFDRLIRRGLGPDEPSGSRSPTGAVLPAALADHTARAMLRFAAGQSTTDLVSSTALSWATTTSRTMQMTRLARIVILGIVGLAATGAAVLATQKPESARPIAPPPAVVQEPKPAKPLVPEKKVELISVRVVDPKGRDVPNVDVEVDDHQSMSEARRFRTGADGRFRAPVAPSYSRVDFLSRPDDRTLGWASITAGNLRPEGTDKDPVTMVLLPLSHKVEGSVVDTQGKPIRGVQVRVFGLDHDANGFATDYRGDQEDALLGSTVTDEAGRYALSLPADTRVHFTPYHLRYVGPTFSCRPEVRTIATVTLQDAGGIAGTVLDATTRKPVAGATIAAQTIELGNRLPLGGGWGDATSDARGHFQIGSLEPGVYNLLFQTSPRGRRFTAQAVEGVRVKAGEDARADLTMIEGRRLSGTAFHINDNTPMAGVPVFCYSSSHPRSGASCQGTYTDEQGRFEHFVPPGPAMVYIANQDLLGNRWRRVLTIPADRDPEPVRIERNSDPATATGVKAFRSLECGVRVRVKAGEVDVPPRDEGRTLSGRIFDSNGSPIAGVRVHYNARKPVSGATDRLGVFRLKGLPPGQFRLHMDKDDYGSGWSIIPPDAWEVDVTLPRRLDRLE